MSAVALQKFDEIVEQAGGARGSLGVAICRDLLARYPQAYVTLRLIELGKTFADVRPDGTVS